MEALIELYFSQKFYPAEDWKDSTLQLSTDEIREAIARHTGNWAIEPSHIYSWMNEHGYVFDSLNGVDMKWMLVER